MSDDPRLPAIPDIHGHAKGEHKPFAEERPIPYTARMLFLWFFHAARRGSPRFLMVADHVNYLTFEDPAAVNLVRRALKLAQAGDLYGASETAGVEVGHAAVVSEGLRRGMRFSIGAEVDNDPRNRPDAQNIVDAMRPDGLVRSIHFLAITHPQHGENWQWPFDNPEFASLYETVGGDRVWEMYAEQLFDAIEKQPTNIVAHFYVPAKFGHWPADDVLEGYEDRLIDLCAEHGIAIEVNSRYLYKFYVDDPGQLERYRTAHLRLLRKAKARGVAVAVGSDAHSPKDQGRAFEAVLALLDEVGINDIAFPLSGRLAHVALRSTDEREPEPTKELAAVAPASAASSATTAGAAGTGEPAGSAAASGAVGGEPRSAGGATPSDETTPGAAPRPAHPRKPRPSRAKPKPAPADRPSEADAAATEPDAAAAAEGEADAPAVETRPAAAVATDAAASDDFPPSGSASPASAPATPGDEHVPEPSAVAPPPPAEPTAGPAAPPPPTESTNAVPAPAAAAKPVRAKPVLAKPVHGKAAVAANPAAGKAVAGRGAASKAVAGKPVAAKSGAGKPTAATSTPAKPASSKPAVKPGVVKPAKAAPKATASKAPAAKAAAKPAGKVAAPAKKAAAPAGRAVAKRPAAKPVAKPAPARKGAAKAPAAKKSSAKRR